jgi:6-phosphogluconolactonase
VQILHGATIAVTDIELCLLLIKKSAFCGKSFYVICNNQFNAFTMNKLLLHLLVILLPGLAAAQKKEKPAPKVYDLIVGGYTNASGGKGITVYRFYAETGRTAFLSEIESVNPTYLCVSPDRKFVYSGSESREGSVSAFSFDYVSGSLKFINKQLSVGANPVHVTIDMDAKNVVASNYGGGTLSVLPINKDGSLAPATQTIKGEGKGAHPQRQAGPHIHSLSFSPDEKYALYADLGTDKISIAKYKAGKIPAISPEDVVVEKVKPGSGPRHMEFSPNGKFLYLVNELGGTINAYSYNKGKLIFIDSLNMSPAGFTGNAGADIHLTPNGKFLYASNRGTANELLVYTVDITTGKLTYVTRYPTGAEPRNFVIEPGGRFLILAAQKGNTIQIYKIDQSNGTLVVLNNPISIPAPTVLKLVSAE